MDLITSLLGHRNNGITLNSQLIDLFNIIWLAQSEDEAIKEVYEYLNGILQASKLAEEMNSKFLSDEQKLEIVIEKAGCSVLDKEKFLRFLKKHKMQTRANWNSRAQVEKLFQDKEVDTVYIEEVLNLRKYFAYQTHGILTFLVDLHGKAISAKSKVANADKDKTYQKVDALYDYVVGCLENGENRFTRLTLDGQGRFETVAGVIETEKEEKAKPEDYNLEPLIQGYEFAKRYEMKEVCINALAFSKDFPDRLVGESKEQYETALTNYWKAIVSVAKTYEEQGIQTLVHIFNELIDYYEPFMQRTNNWMSKLSIEDLCRIAITIKGQMPNAHFGYNDFNFENPHKREKIFEVIRRIQLYERENSCKILDYIGTQCHISINEIEGLRQSIEELQQFGLPIDITELDITKGLDGVDYKMATPEELAVIIKYEQKLQNEIMKMLSDFVKTGKIRSITAGSLTDEICPEFCNGKQASITNMSYDSENGFVFSGKNIDAQIDITEQEIDLIKAHKQRVKESKMQKVSENPIQDFCFHTHTSRCDHRAKDTSDDEWVQNAIKGGIARLAFTEHIPIPEEHNKAPNMRMDIVEVDSYLGSIRYLQEKYSGQIEIESGFEFEYSDRNLAYLKEFKSKTDKMILGQHWVIDGVGKEYAIARGKNGEQISDDVLDLYYTSIISAIDNQLPDIIAHPDFFMQCRDYFGTKEKEIARNICRKAAKAGIPLEINLGRIVSKVNSNLSTESLKQTISYPSKEFWKIVAEETELAKENGQNLFVIFGKDAHSPEELSEQRDYEIAIEILGIETLKSLNFIDKDFNLDYNMITRILEVSRSNKLLISETTARYLARLPEVAVEMVGAMAILSELIKNNEKNPNDKVIV